ncbi:MAG: M42 family peptidase [Oscillospiraceae bacterium]|nr:M42 family peptidase [Oscillospiraceae bacterium]
MTQTIQDLCTLGGTSGREQAVRDYIKSLLPQEAKTITDNLGNLLVFREGRQRSKNKVMLCAHMDEVGVIVTGIGADGLLSFAAVGGIDPRVILGRRILFDNGILGVVGLTPVHLIDHADRQKMPKIDDMYIDIGAKDKDDAQQYLSPGDTGVFDSDFVSFGDCKIKGKALDDRVGCAVLIDLLREQPEYDMWAAFTTREEVGLVGAKTAAFGVAPDYAIVLETTTAADIIGVSGEKQVCVLGRGAAVSFMDKTTVYDPDLYKKAFELADANHIAIQPKTVVAGGNDAGVIHKSRAGVRTLTVNTPCRYLHSASCVCDTRDIESVRALACVLFEDFCNA